MPSIFIKQIVVPGIKKNIAYVLLSSVFAGEIFLARALTPIYPVYADSTSIRRGEELFASDGCAHCHGDHGIGGGKGPDLKNVAHHMNAIQMAAQVHDGGKNMPPYGDVLSDQQIGDLVNYLRSRRKALHKLPEAKAASPNQNVSH